MQPGLQGYIKRRRGTPSGLQYGRLESEGGHGPPALALKAAGRSSDSTSSSSGSQSAGKSLQAYQEEGAPLGR